MGIKKSRPENRGRLFYLRGENNYPETVGKSLISVLLKVVFPAPNNTS
jgi:hypothetical protein